MFGLGFWEAALILVVALIVLGPHRLPGLARQLGKLMREFRRATGDLQSSLELSNEAEPRPPAVVEDVEAHDEPARSLAPRERGTAAETSAPEIDRRESGQ